MWQYYVPVYNLCNEIYTGRWLAYCCLSSTLCLKKNCTPKAGRHKFIKISSPMMIFHTRHRHSVADRLSSKSLVRVEYQLQGFHGNQAPNNRMPFITDRIRRRRALFIAYIWRHSDVIIIKLTAFIQNEISYKTYISDFFCIRKITEFMPTCLRGAVFFETQCSLCSALFISVLIIYCHLKWCLKR